ncbi:MAG: sensor histidine kinase [Archangium sp.]
MSSAAQPFISAVQQLALASTRQQVIETLAATARSLTGADGTTVVFRDGDKSFYVHEDAMAPLFAPGRFPINACVSGWVMENSKPALIDDVYADARVPIEVYRPTFVKSMGMVPIRSSAPIGAVGFYWATGHRMTPEELERAQALADSAAVALQNVNTLENLEERVRERTQQLTQMNQDLRLFAGSVAHDLRSPLTLLIGDAEALQYDDLPAEERGALAKELMQTALHMNGMLQGLLDLSHVTSRPLAVGPVDLSRVAEDSVRLLRSIEPERRVETRIEAGLRVDADEGLMRVVLGNLLHNAWKYTSRKSDAHIRFGIEPMNTGDAYVVQDDGAGFDAKNLSFEAFRRHHTSQEFPGTGLGLATVHRAITRHGGSMWAESSRGSGARFYFRLPPRAQA